MKILIKSLLSQRLRIILTYLNIFIATIVISFVLIISDSIENGFIKVLENFNTNELLISGSISQAVTKDINNIGVHTNYQNLSMISTDGTVITPNIHVTNTYGLKAIKKEIFSIEYIDSIELLGGRFWNSEDELFNRKYIIINDFLAKRLFGNNDPIGRKITLFKANEDPLQNKYKNQFEIIGVTQTQEKNVFANFSEYMRYEIYMPYLTYMNNYNININRIDYITINKDYELNSQTSRKFQAYCHSENLCNVTTFFDAYEQMEALINDQTTTLLPFLLIMIIFGGLNIIITTIYTYKEKKYEIGIRKTLGATRFDIFSQLILENAIISIVSSISAFIISYIGCTILLRLLYIKGYVPDSSIFISPISYYFIILTPIFISFIISIIPGLFISKLKIIDCLRK